MATSVVLLMRKPLPGQHSVERVFRGVAANLPADISIDVVTVPFVSRGLLRRVGNMLFAASLRPDVVHVTGDIQYCSILIRRRRSLLTVLDLTSLRRLSGWRRSVLVWVWYRIPCRRTRTVTTISESTRDELVELHPPLAAKSLVVPCPIADEFLGEHPHHAPNVPPEILLVGTSANKNLTRVLKALTGLPVKLRVIGLLNDEQRSALDLSGLDVENTANLSDDDLLDAYVRCDIVLFASLYEGFGLPIIEAQAIGRPVITSNTASMPEVAGLGAILVDPLDESEIRDAVTSLLESAPLRESLTTHGAANVGRFAPSVIAEQYAEIYRSYRTEG